MLRNPRIEVPATERVSESRRARLNVLVEKGRLPEEAEEFMLAKSRREADGVSR